MLEHGFTCYQGIIVHHGNAIVLKLPYLNMRRLLFFQEQKVVPGKTLIPFQVNVRLLSIVFEV